MELDFKEFGIGYFKGRIYVESFMFHVLLVIDKGEFITHQKIEDAIANGNIVSLVYDKEDLSNYHTNILRYNESYINALFNYTGVFNTDYKWLYKNGYVMLAALCKEILREPSFYIEETTE